MKISEKRLDSQFFDEDGAREEEGERSVGPDD